MTMNADEMLENRSRTKSRFAFGWQMARTRRTSPECGPRRHHCGGDGRSTGTPACSVGGRSRDLHGPCDMTTTAANLRRLQDAISNLLRFEWQARLRHRRPSPSRIGGRQYGDSNIPTFSRIASAFLRTQSSSNGNYMMKHVDLYRLSISAAAMSVGDFVAPKAGKHLGSNFWRIVSRSHSAGAAGAVALRRAEPRGCLPPWTRRHRQLRVTILRSFSRPLGASDNSTSEKPD